MHAINRRLHDIDDFVQLKITPYDRVSSLLMTLLILFGLGVGVLFVLWLAIAPPQSSREGKVVQFEETGRSAAEPSELEQPASTELSSLATEELSTDLSTVTAAAELVGQEESLFRGHAPIAGKSGSFTRDVESSDIIPRWERWAIRLEARTPAEYAALLDFFQIELGALGGGSRTIHYASQFSSSQPAVRIGEPQDEHRLYMTWRSGELRARDEQLLSRAGVDVANKVLLQFYPRETENRLALLEREHAGGRPVTELRRTTFGVRPVENGFEFHVISQIYR